MQHHLLDESFEAGMRLLMTALWRLKLLASVPQLGYDVDGDGEDNGAVFLRRNVIESLQVAQLRRVKEHIIRACLVC